MDSHRRHKISRNIRPPPLRTFPTFSALLAANSSRVSSRGVDGLRLLSTSNVIDSIFTSYSQTHLTYQNVLSNQNNHFTGFLAEASAGVVHTLDTYCPRRTIAVNELACCWLQRNTEGEYRHEKRSSPDCSGLERKFYSITGGRCWKVFRSLQSQLRRQRRRPQRQSPPQPRLALRRLQHL